MPRTVFTVSSAEIISTITACFDLPCAWPSSVIRLMIGCRISAKMITAGTITAGT